jgi:hypothetical protein
MLTTPHSDSRNPPGHPGQPAAERRRRRPVKYPGQIRQVDAPERAAMRCADQAQTTAMPQGSVRIHNIANVAQRGAIGCVARSPKT